MLNVGDAKGLLGEIQADIVGKIKHTYELC